MCVSCKPKSLHSVCVCVWCLTWWHNGQPSYLSVSGCICSGSVKQEPKEEAVDRFQQIWNKVRGHWGSKQRKQRKTDWQEEDSSHRENEDLVGNDRASNARGIGKKRKIMILSQPTVDFLPCCSSVFGHMNSDPSSYRAHFLTPVTQKRLKFLWCTRQWIQSHTTLPCAKKKNQIKTRLLWEEGKKVKVH